MEENREVAIDDLMCCGNCKHVEIEYCPHNMNEIGLPEKMYHRLICGKNRLALQVVKNYYSCPNWEWDGESIFDRLKTMEKIK
jgi:hypothetical protein